ncbi:tyrosine-type recombinase/integrase [Hydrogenophaga sp.]|uniref:tyrosine-type recombinase/integrase n=1 Tax=Hydrogenophaga sp. TaxID=1904254 RepID=UPI003D272C93
MRTESTPSIFINEQPQVGETAVGPSKGSKQATPYKHGKGYAMRKQHQGHDIFVSGFKTQAAARKAMARKVAAIDMNRVPVGAGPKKTSLAQALQDYAIQHLPFLKGAQQEARRINNYLRPAGLRLLKVSKAETPSGSDPKTGSGCHFNVELVAHTTQRVIPQGLAQHRRALMNANARTDKFRAVLASTPMQDVSRVLVQQFVNAMRQDGHSASTVALERALLRSLFNHAFTTWHWDELQDNPATKLTMPKVDNERKRVLSFDEQALLEQALAECRNTRVEPALTLLRESGMRASEPLEIATWGDVDWDRWVLRLNDGKAGSREVPLSPAAMGALEALGRGKDDERIVGISYEALRAAWKRACRRAGIADLRIHDLRHTAATRMALSTGNVFLVQALTGHKNLKMLERYVNVSADDVVKVMRAAAQSALVASSTAQSEVQAGGIHAEPTESAPITLPSNVIQFPLRKAA